MTDRQLAELLAAAKATERDARAYWQQIADVAEKDAAIVVVRHVTALRRSLEAWMATRATRVALHRTSG